MINHKRKAIFIHTPKTGGTSIKKNIDGFTTLGDHKNWLQEKKLTKQYWDKYFKFAFVRNPWDRVYSIYSYYKMGKNVTLVDPNKLPNNFDLFVDDLGHYLNMLGLTYTQSAFIGPELNFVGKFENLQHDFNHIQKKLNIRPKKLTRERKSKRNSNYKDVYKPKMIGIVESLFDEDIKRFKYEF